MVRVRNYNLNIESRKHYLCIRSLRLCNPYLKITQYCAYYNVYNSTQIIGETTNTCRFESDILYSLMCLQIEWLYIQCDPYPLGKQSKV